MGNRIRELREGRDWSQQDLADRVGTTQQQIGRLEGERRRLTQDWMERIARALEVRPSDLFTPEDSDEIGESELSLIEDESFAPIARSLAHRGLALYRVETDAVSDSGVIRGEMITVDQTSDAITRAKTGDIVLVETGLAPRKSVLLRVLVRPALLTTNRTGANAVFRIDNPALDARIKGVVLRE